MDAPVAYVMPDMKTIFSRINLIIAVNSLIVTIFYPVHVGLGQNETLRDWKKNKLDSNATCMHPNPTPDLNPRPK